VASPSPTSTQPAGGSAVRTGLIGTIVAALAFFDGVVLGAPVAMLAASFGPLIVYLVATAVAIVLTIASCRWVDRRWEDWFSGNASRVGKRLDAMRASRLMRHPVAWVERGSDRWYALAAAVGNPILVLALSRSITGKPVGERRILLGCVAYAIPYVAIWSFVGWAIGDTVRDA
jgi:hypothetical protein